jgi:arylsulfatase A-like enzyme/Flp pilus assembly protein TadD
MFRLEDSRLTLAEILEQAGYRTGAFIGSFVLDARFGLSQGFDVYDDYYGEETGFADFNFVERRAEKVLSPATAWIEQDEGRPWFAWVHLFDPHVPYRPPDPYRERYRDHPYAGEVAYTDHALGSFLERLHSTRRLENTLLVATADHGESLGEHGEKTHGAFAYNSTLQVPLILWAKSHLKPQVFSETVSHVDLVPTILELLGFPVPDSVQGNTLLPRLSGQGITDSRPIYFETLHPYLTQNLAPLTGIIDGEYKFIELPLPELYHIPRDPQEETNLFAGEEARAGHLRNTLEELVATMGATAGRDIRPVSLDEETRKRLEALGYIASASPPSRKDFTAADDPKNAIRLIEDQRAAMSLHASGESEEAISLLQNVIKEREDFTAAHINLASILFGTGRLPEAINVLEKAAGNNPESAWVLGSLGIYYCEAGELARAVRTLNRAIEKAPNNADTLNSLGVAYAQMGKRDDALSLFERVLELDPSSAGTHNNIGAIFLREQDFPKAIDYFRRVIELAPGFWAAYDGLGTALAANGQLSEAVEAWKQLLELNPAIYDALYNIGVALVELGRDREALIYLEKFLREAPPERHAEDIQRLKLLAEDVRKRLH